MAGSATGAAVSTHYHIDPRRSDCPPIGAQWRQPERLGAALIAPATTVLLAAIAGGAGLLAALPESPPGWLGEWVRGDDGWRWSWLPLTPWIAVPLIVVALAAVPSRIVRRLDDRWWQKRKRAQETVDAWVQP